MKSFRENPESEENARLARDNEREVFALQMAAKVEYCEHDELDHGICLHCGKDCDMNSHGYIPQEEWEERHEL